MSLSLQQLLQVKGGVDESLEQLQGLLTRNKLDDSLLDEIRRKRSQKELIVSVIGEVNSGKSTLINALLRTELMEMSVETGFTNFNTLIEYGDEYDVHIRFKDQTKSASLQLPEDRTDKKRLLWRYVRHPQAKHVYQALQKIRKDEPLAKSIDHVVLRVPSELLRLGITLIDTPGYNGGEEWHHEAAARSVRELSDMSLILTPCQQALGQAFIQTLRREYEHGLEESLFVITKADLVKQKDIDMVTKYVRGTLKKELGLNDPLVCPYSSWAVMHDCGMLEEGTYDPALVEQSHVMERNLLNLLIERRTQCLIKVMTHRVEDVKKRLGSQLDDIKTRAQAAKQRCIDNRKDKLEKFARARMDELASAYGLASTKAIVDYSQKPEACQSEAYQGIKALYMSSAFYALGGFTAEVQQRFGVFIERQQAIMTEDLNALQASAKTLTKGCVKQFAQAYPELTKLVVSVKGKGDGSISVALGQVDVESMATAMVKGGQSGYKAGSDMAGVFGGLIGGTLGVIGGLFKGLWNMFDSRETRWNRISPKINQSLSEITRHCVPTFRREADGIGRDLMDQIQEYVKKYSAAVDQLIKQSEREEAELQTQINQVETDIRQITLIRPLEATQRFMEERAREAV